jgi:hypothetical protein
MCKTKNLVPLLLDQFLTVATFIPFGMAFTVLTSLCKRGRIVILKKYSHFGDRKVQIDLSGTTKLIKKMPKHVACRLSDIRVTLRGDARFERIQRFVQFYENAKAPHLALELINLDDSEKNTIEMLDMFADMHLS